MPSFKTLKNNFLSLKNLKNGIPGLNLNSQRHSLDSLSPSVHFLHQNMTWQASHYACFTISNTIKFCKRFVGFFVGVCFRSSYDLIIGADTSGFEWSGVGNWRGFVLWRNCVTDCCIGGLSAGLQGLRVLYPPSVFLMHSGHFQ